MKTRSTGKHKSPPDTVGAQAQRERLDKLLEKLRDRELFPESNARAREIIKKIKESSFVFGK